MTKDIKRLPSPVPEHHPHDDLLLGYAAGKLTEEYNLIIASHLHRCPQCRAKVGDAEILLSNFFIEEGVNRKDKIRPGEFEDLWEKLQSREAIKLNDAPKDPLAHYLDKAADKIIVKNRGKFSEKILPLKNARASLMHITAGTHMPSHRHEGYEMTLVLEGGFQDSFGAYAPGDFCMVGPGIKHAPVVHDDGDCVCLTVNTGDIKLTGFLGFLLNPFLKVIY